MLESGEPREVHHFALLIGYGAGAINPYLAFETLDDMIRQGMLPGIDHEKAVKNYVKAVNKGVVKVMSKMGISTAQSYCGAQIFEAIGLSKEVIDQYFTWTPSRIGGIGLDVIAEEVQARHDRAFPTRPVNGRTLDVGGHYQYRQRGRVPPVQPGDDPQAPARLPHRQLQGVQGVQRARQQPGRSGCARCAACWSSSPPRRRCRSRKSNRSSRSSSGSSPAPCRTARSARRRTRRWPSP